MARVMLEHYRRFDCPLILLTMSGDYDQEKGPGEWGMRSWLVDKEGELSLAAQEMLRFVGSDPNPEIDREGTPDPEPDPEPEEKPDPKPKPPKKGKDGRNRLRRAGVALDRAVQRWNRPGGPRQAELAIKLIEEALGRRREEEE